VENRASSGAQIREVLMLPPTHTAHCPTRSNWSCEDGGKAAWGL
jgi:hypothetical protein